MIEGGPSMGSIGMETGASTAVMSVGAEVGAMASGGVLAQATAVAEQAWGVNPTSALDAAQAAMHSTAREAWTATDPAPVSVLSPQVTAMLAFTGLQAQQALSPVETASPVSTFTIQSEVDQIAQRAWAKSEPYSVLDEARDIVNTVLSPSVQVLSPSEVLGLASFATQAQENFTQVASAAPEPEVVVSAAISPESSFSGLSTVSVVNEAIDTLVTENPNSLDVTTIGNEKANVLALDMTIAPEQEVPLDSSDGAVAQRVAMLAGEIGLAGIESEANAVVERITAPKMVVEEPAKNLVRDSGEVMSEVDKLRVEQNTNHIPHDNTKPTNIGPVEDGKANETRRDILTGVVEELEEATDEGTILGSELARRFVRQAQNNDLAQSEIVRASRVPDGTIRYIADDLSRQKFQTPPEAEAAFREAILTHTAVAMGTRRQVSDRAVEKVFEGASSAKTFLLAA